MRLIDADAFVADARMVKLDTAEKVFFALAHQPSIDIVKCKECRYFSVISDEEEGTNYYMCGVWSNATDKDAFCSYGKRSE